MIPVDEEIIVIGDDEPDERPPAEQGCVEVIVEDGPSDERGDGSHHQDHPDEDHRGTPDIDDIEPMPAVQRGVLVLVAVLIVVGILLLIAYWTGLPSLLF